MLDKISDVFLPDEHVLEPAFMFGRKDALRDVLMRFQSSRRSVVLIKGPPGIGKSSLLSMLHLVLVGDTEPLRRFNLESFAPGEVNRLVVFLRCTVAMSSPDLLCDAARDGISEALDDSSRSTWARVDKVEIRAGLPFASIAAELRPSDARKDARSGQAGFRDLVREVVRDSQIDEIVFLLDECEQLVWLDQLVEMTRTFDGERIRFILATRDAAVHKLIPAVAGNYRFVNEVPLHPLDRVDIDGFYERAAEALLVHEIHWMIDEAGLDLIQHRSNGEPWYLHMIGQELLYLDLVRFDGGFPLGAANFIRVGRREIELAEEKLVQARSLALSEPRYRNVVGRSVEREAVLKALARCPETVIPLQFQKLMQDFFPNSRRLILALSRGDDPVLSIDANREVSFVEHQFRVYCRLRDPLTPSISINLDLLLTEWRNS